MKVYMEFWKVAARWLMTEEHEKKNPCASSSAGITGGGGSGRLEAEMKDRAYVAGIVFPSLLTMSAVELQLDIDEFEALLAASERPNVKAVLEKEKARLEAEIKALESKAERASAEGVSDVSALLLSLSCSLFLPLRPH
jgi:hypothetical protein